MNYLGFGVVSYFDLLKVMIFVFLVFTLLHMPIMRIYEEYDNFSDEVMEGKFNIFSLGNMGFSTTKCSSTGIMTDKIVLSCKTGNITEIVDHSFAAKWENKDYCRTNTTGVCSNVASPQLKKDLMGCIGKSSCQITKLKSYITSN